MRNAKNKSNGGDVKIAPNTNGSNDPKEQTKLDYSKTYKVIALVSNKFLKENIEYNVTGKLAEKMINNNQAKLKD